MDGLYLHVGHMKTGSSYVQSSLAGSVDLLARHGLHYPATDEVLKARRGTISSGNGFYLFHDFVGTGRLPSPPSDASLLFSGEHIFQWLLKPAIRDQLLRRLGQLDTDHLRVLLFIRDPVAHACSMYQESVKRGGYNGTIEDYFCAYDYVRDANAVLDFLESIPFCEVTVRNYSALNAVLPTVETWLSLPGGSLATPPSSRVNRSLSFAELELQRLLNAALGKSGHLLSARLCNELPDIRSDDIRPTLEVQERLWDRLAPEIERMNARVPPEDRYVRERDIVKPTLTHEAFAFSREQLAIVAASMAGQAKAIARLKNEIDAQRAESLAAHTKALDAIRSSRSWRLTEPLRRLATTARRLSRPRSSAAFGSADRLA